VHIIVHPGAAVGDSATLTITPPKNSELHIQDDATTGAARSDDTTSVEIVWTAQKTLRVTGSVPLDARDGSVLDASVLNPGLFALDIFAQHLASAGITTSTPPGEQAFSATPPNARVLWLHHSAPLSQLLASMWQPSDNLIAESLLDALGAGADDARAAGIARETDWLRRIDVEPETLTIADGSGLSNYDRMTPRALVAILHHDWTGSSRDAIMAALPQPGKKGTLEHVFTGSPLVGRLFAKTGTVNHTRTLAGYLQTTHGTLIFALMVNDWIDPAPDASANLRDFQQAFLTALL
jgi:D-alanyl-D-alanine carboxypeptidase/D-alanyl-D-alanine-endopeptidase (penicillin-binding protein 4)